MNARSTPLRSNFLHALKCVVGLLALSCISKVSADITVQVSVKFILKADDGSRPAGDGVNAIDISTESLFNIELEKANQVLASAGRGYRLAVTYDDIQPLAPTGEAPSYWFTLDARENRAVIESAATTDATAKSTWKWRDDAINIYVNNSSSGQCSFVGAGKSISLGATIFTRGSVIHEIGHFFNLKHTHAGDTKCSQVPPPYLVANGDGLSETIDDHNCLTTPDALSMAYYNGKTYAELNPLQRDYVDSSWFNVMSYHQEDRLLDVQMDIWTTNANMARLYVCNARTWYVAIGGSDGASGAESGEALETVREGLARVSSPNDVVLLWRGSYSAPPGGIISTACTLSATRGPAFLTRP